VVYVALLRGINVGGNKRIKMDKLRQSFEALGFEQVQTFIQSGNVIFKAAKFPSAKLAKRIGERILADFGFAVPVVLRTALEISEIVASNPFVRERGIDSQRLHVMFLSEAPKPDGLRKIENLTIAPDRFHCVETQIFLHLPNGAGESKLMKAPLDRWLSVIATTRNWQTVNSLDQMCRKCGR